MTRTALRALSLQNYWENPRMRAGKSRSALLEKRSGHFIKCLLTELGRAGQEKYLARGHGVRPSHSVYKYILFLDRLPRYTDPKEIRQQPVRWQDCVFWAWIIYVWHILASLISLWSLKRRLKNNLIHITYVKWHPCMGNPLSSPFISSCISPFKKIQTFTFLKNSGKPFLQALLLTSCNLSNNVIIWSGK